MPGKLTQFYLLLIVSQSVLLATSRTVLEAKEVTKEKRSELEKNTQDPQPSKAARIINDFVTLYQKGDWFNLARLVMQRLFVSSKVLHGGVTARKLYDMSPEFIKDSIKVRIQN